MSNSVKHFFILVFLLSLGACSGTKEIVQTVPNYDLENALLWKVTGNGINEACYVFGTIHIIDKNDFFLPKGTLSAIDLSEEMVFEIDMNEMTDLSKQMGLLSDLFMKDEISLKDLLTKEDYKLVSEHFSKMGLPLFFFERMKPMFLTVFASSDFDPTGLQNGELKSYEMEFLELANESNKPVSGLETIEFQMSIFDKIPYKDQAKILVESISQSDVSGSEFQKMIEIYKAQDINAMIEMITNEDSDYEEHEDILIVERNKNWIPIMVEKMKLHVTFFAVGAGHLAGKNGVIHLLKNEGFTVSPIIKQ